MPERPTAADRSAARIAQAQDREMVDLAPVSLWLEDYRAVRALFDKWREQGVIDLRGHLRADLSRVKACTDAIVVTRVNARTLALFEARDLAHLTANLGRVFRDDMLDQHIEELAALWDGHQAFTSKTVNYTLGGRRLDIQLSGRVLPGHESNWERVLIAIEDVTEREVALRRLASSEAYATGLFEHSPVSLWVEDFSGVKRLLDEARHSGIQDFRVFTDVHPEFIDRCMAEIIVRDVNQHTIDLFGAADKPTLLRRLGEVFRDGMRQPFKEQLIDLWHGKLFQQREVINYALDGGELHLHLQFSVLPGHETDWSLVQVALTDITARKKAEAYLEFLGKHDVLTKLHNRSFYNDEIQRLERRNRMPVTIIMADLNGLKAVNDGLGHGAGDALLARAGEVLSKAIDSPHHVARIGGDEFAILMPDSDERDGAALMKTIDELVALNNQFHSHVELSFCMGQASREVAERLEDTARRADEAMYVAKRAFYASKAERRRRA